MLAHIVGIPVEETTLSVAPIAAAAGGLAGIKLRRLAARRRFRLHDAARARRGR